MRIDKSQLGRVQQVYQQQQKKTREQQGKKTDKMDISQEAREIEQLQQKLKQMPATREERVSELKQLVDSGNYRVEAREVARKMLADLEQSQE